MLCLNCHLRWSGPPNCVVCGAPGEPISTGKGGRNNPGRPPSPHSHTAAESLSGYAANPTGEAMNLKEEIEILARESEGLSDASLYLAEVVDDVGCTYEEAYAALLQHYGVTPVGGGGEE